MARFLDALDLKEEAFKIAKDNDHRFELALNLGKIEEAFIIADQDHNEGKYKQVGDLALLNG